MLDEFLPDDLVFLNLYFEDYKAAINNLKSDKFYPSLLSMTKTTDAIESLDKDGISESDKKAFDGFLLRILNGDAYKAKNEIYDTVMSQLRNKAAITIINNIYKSYGWIDKY